MSTVAPSTSHPNLPHSAVVNGIQRSGGKGVSNLSDAFVDLGIDGSHAVNDADARDGIASSMNKRFRKMATMTAEQLENASPNELHRMLAVTPPSVSESPTTRTEDPRPIKKQAQYAQVFHKGPTSYGSDHEATTGTMAADPLRRVCRSLYDVVCQEIDADVEPCSSDYEQIACNDAPMVREYFPKFPEEENEENMEDDGYVYDLYIEAGGSEQENNWMELHQRGHAPIVYIVDDNTWLVQEASDAEDSAVDSEDSNAEGFYANDYPDEGGLDEFDSDNSEEYERGCTRQLRERYWYEDSAGSDLEYDT